MKKGPLHISENSERPKHSHHWHTSYRVASILSKGKKSLNITFGWDSPVEKMLSNLAPTPFVLDGREYASVEGFWQGLKFEDEAQRAIIAKISGIWAKKASEIPRPSFRFQYNWNFYSVGSLEHHDLMRRAIRAKLEQNPHVLRLLLATGNTLITHEPRKKDGTLYPDSTTIPGKIFSQILMELREEFRILQK